MHLFSFWCQSKLERDFVSFCVLLFDWFDCVVRVVEQNRKFDENVQEFLRFNIFYFTLPGVYDVESRTSICVLRIFNVIIFDAPI